MIVDAQGHLWKANTPDRPWVPNRVAQLPEPFTMEKLVPMMDEAGVYRVVIVPPSWEGGRNDMRSKRCAAIQRDSPSWTGFRLPIRTWPRDWL